MSEKAAKTSETVVKRGESALEVQREKLKKVSLEGDLKSLYEELGKCFYESCSESEMSEDLAAICEKITACKDSINESDHKVAVLKGVVICSSCGAEVSKDAAFCPKCGAPIVHDEEEAGDDTEAETEDTECEDSGEESSEETAEEESVSEDEAGNDPEEN